METDLTQQILEKVSTLSAEEKKEVLRLLENRAAPRQKADSRPIWEVITEISSQIPEEMWADLPTDGSVNVDHYLYGAPKKVE